jgi:hypothetical protein
LPQSPLEAAGQDQLQDQWFGDGGKAVAYAELEAERAAVVVDNAINRSCPSVARRRCREKSTCGRRQTASFISMILASCRLLINNMLGQIATVAIAEALVFGKKAGLDPQKIYEVVRVSTGKRPFQSRRISLTIAFRVSD